MDATLASRPAYPRPPVAFQTDVLFREPVYADGPYDRGDEDEVLEDPAIITCPVSTNRVGGGFVSTNPVDAGRGGSSSGPSP